MPKFKTLEEAHKVHKEYDIDTDSEGKYNIDNVYSIGRNRIEYLLNSIPIDSYVLEVGCNSGGLMRVLSSERNCYCHGVDISDKMVKRALSKGCFSRYGTAEQLPYSENVFDVVVITEVLEHLYNPSVAMDEIFRVLNCGGLVIGTVPHPDGHNSKKKSVDKHDWHCTIFNETTLRELLKKRFTNITIDDISWYNDQENKPQWIGFSARKPND